MGRLIDVDDLCRWLGFKDTQEERDNNYAEDITLEEIDRIETVNVAEREEVKKLIREAKKKAIDDFCEKLQTETEYAKPVGWTMRQEIIQFGYVRILAEEMKEVIELGGMTE